MEARLIGYKRREWFWEHDVEGMEPRRAGPFESHVACFHDLARRMGPTSAVEAIRRQIVPTASECARAAAEHGFPSDQRRR